MRPVASTPLSTYRLQLNAQFSAQDAAHIVDYLAELGVTHLYLSPILQSVPGSGHGYDGVDPTKLDQDRGGGDGFEQLWEATRRHGLKMVVDLVPNHLGVPEHTCQNPFLYEVLRNGQQSRYAHFFDIDWEAGHGKVVLPFLGQPLEECLSSDLLTIGTDVQGLPALCYGGQTYPLASGTENLPITQAVAAQHYRLRSWKLPGITDDAPTADTDPEPLLNYRRFFDVPRLIAVRVEDPRVFAALVTPVLRLVPADLLAGIRIDHPDGLADPESFLNSFHQALPQPTWVVVEKILEGAETLPPEWETEGTTGYDAILRINQLLTSGVGCAQLAQHYAAYTGLPADFDEVVHDSKLAALRILTPELDRLLLSLRRIAAHDERVATLDSAALREVLTEVLVAFEVYRAYLRPGRAPSPTAVGVVEGAITKARRYLHHPQAEHILAVLRHLVLGLGSDGQPVTVGPLADRIAEFSTRCAQTFGPVMAKGIEDTAFYRHLAFPWLNEVGGDPAHPAIEPQQFTAWAQQVCSDYPATLTTLSTHDAKRAEDVRARLMVLAELPDQWQELVAALDAATADQHHSLVDANARWLLWSSLLGTWPAHSPDEVYRSRLAGYMQKATREAKVFTAWTKNNAAYDQAIEDFTIAAVNNPRVDELLTQFLHEHTSAMTANVLGQKLLQLLGPGVADVYQGSELLTDSLVDPDNRRLVDYQRRRDVLARVKTWTSAAGCANKSLDELKLWVTTTGLQLRRDSPSAFLPGASFEALTTTSEHAYGWLRTGPDGAQVAAALTRFPVGLAAAGGWSQTTLTLPEGTWSNLVTGTTHPGGTLPLGEVLAPMPVVGWVREGERKV